MTLLITGAGGFVGMEIIAGWQPRSQRIIAVDNSREIIWNNTVSNKGDVADQKLMAEIMAKHKPTTIVHLAAVSARGQPASLNAPMTMSVLNAALTLDTKPKIVIAGSAAEYGDVPDGVFPSEDDAPNPDDDYAASKLISTIMAMAYANLFGLPIVVLRFGNIFGPRQTNRLIPNIIRDLFNVSLIKLAGDGKPQRPWLYIDDACRAIWMAATSKRTGVFNVALPGSVPNVDIFMSIFNQIKNAMPDRQWDPMTGRVCLVSEGGGTKRVAMSVEHAKTALGWQPLVSLRDGIRKTVEYHLKEQSCEV